MLKWGSKGIAIAGRWMLMVDMLKTAFVVLFARWLVGYVIDACKARQDMVMASIDVVTCEL